MGKLEAAGVVRGEGEDMLGALVWWGLGRRRHKLEVRNEMETMVSTDLL